jgi:hypothetical protein
VTVIAWDGKTLAADRYSEQGYVRGERTKIRRLADGRLVGAAGRTSISLEVIAWLENGGLPSDYPASARGDDAAVIVVNTDGKAVIYDCGPVPLHIEGRKYVAIGSGAEAAMAAMYLGCDAVRACHVAGAVVVRCGGNGFDTLTLEPLTEAPRT